MISFRRELRARRSGIRAWMFATLLLSVGAAAQAGELKTVVSDKPLPGAAGGSLTVQVEAGRPGGSFHVTFERDGAWYTTFDGSRWTKPVQVTEGIPFRSGVHLAIDAENVAHAAWVEGGGDRRGTVKYRTLRVDGKLGPVEDVHGPQGWNECDIALDHSGRPVIAANTSTQSEMAIYERQPDGSWLQTVLPSDNTLHKWAPTIVAAENGLLYVAFRRKDGHPFTWQVRDRGEWTKDAVLPFRSYEPNAIAHGRGILASSMDGYVYRVTKHGDTYTTSADDVRSAKRRVIRGQHVGIGLTRAGTLVLSHSDMANEDQRDRTIAPTDRFYMSFSRDGGKTWTYNQPLATEPGQGHGDLAVNGNSILAVWPDLRDGAHLRYSLLEDN